MLSSIRSKCLISMTAESTTVSRLAVSLVVVVGRGQDALANIANMAVLAAIKSGHENHRIG